VNGSESHKEPFQTYLDGVYPQKLKGKTQIKKSVARQFRKISKLRPLTKSENTFFKMLLGASQISQNINKKTK
jgi:hypothetical protein